MVTKLTLEYDGGAFAGWGRQPGLRTVQEELEEALHTILGVVGHDGRALAARVAGRTDAGVHAWAQVASYVHEAVDPARLNGLLGAEVAVLAAEPAPEGFDARRDARSRVYCYRVLARRERSALQRGRALWWAGHLERDALLACAQALRGRHDFRAFTPAETEHTHFEREILRAEWRARDPAPCAADLRESGEQRARTTVEATATLLEFWIEAPTFLRHMVRALVGTMLEVATGARSLSDFERLLEGAPRTDAGKTAAPHGLALAHVRYD